MDESSFEQKIGDLLNSIGDIPSPQRDKILFLARKNNEHYQVLQSKIATLQNSLDYLRLGVKYMIFDLEATRRENTDLRKQLEQATLDQHRQRESAQDDLDHIREQLHAERRARPDPGGGAAPW